jgi:hypothetical protein
MRDDQADKHGNRGHHLKIHDGLDADPPDFFGVGEFRDPTTTVTNTIGAMIIRTSLMKASPNGCICTASAGQKYPSAAPSTTPSRTWMYSPFAERALLPAIA